MDLKSKIILISGPTASGKSNFAIKLAKKIKGEIINADSMQVYKQLQILTARPRTKEVKKIKDGINIKKNFENEIKEVQKTVKMTENEFSKKN